MIRLPLQSWFILQIQIPISFHWGANGMESGIFWDVFESTGSIEAYLTYSRTEQVSYDTNVVGGVLIIDEDQETKIVKREKFEIISEYS